MIRRTIVLAFITVVAVAAVLSYRAWLEPRPPMTPRPASRSLSSEEARRAIAARDSVVIAALTSRDLAALSRFVHPSKGVRISHTVYVRPDSDVVVTASSLRQAGQDSREFLWGYGDGTGDPIRMTLRAYLEEYLATDFSKATLIGYNAVPMRVGNTPNTVAEIYPHAIRVERHFPGFEKRYEGMDWQSLWLVYEQLEGEWYLIGIARGFWTI